METNQVRYFLALCEERSFTRAAKRCGVSQPSISNAIRLLEEELGGTLFYRSKKKTKLSPLGVAIRPYLNQINQGVNRARRHRSRLVRSTQALSVGRRERSKRR
jgi:LysR family transcriptional regulator, hydrogen peroxide-inducible genes activator